MEGSRHLLAGVSTEPERLSLQANVWEGQAEQLLERVGLGLGASAIDLGCGPSGILGPLHRRVGRTGRVVGIERDPSLLGEALSHAVDSGLDGIELLERDAFETGLPPGTFDFVHARFLAAPTGRAEELLREMVRLAKPGGVIAIEEPDSATWAFHPASWAFNMVRRAILRAFERQGGDFDAGRRLPELFERAGLEQVETRSEVQWLTPGHPYRRLAIQFAESLDLHRTALRIPLAECERHAADPTRSMRTFALVQCVGRVPQRRARVA